jgi:hypothetical protein
LLTHIIIETSGEVLLKVLHAGKVSTNVYLRRLHNFCVDMNWLPWPIIPKRQWPAVKYKGKRAITLEENQQIIAAEVNPERKRLCQASPPVVLLPQDPPLSALKSTAAHAGRVRRLYQC